MNTIKTVLHAFTFNTKEPEDSAAWAELKAARKADGVKLFDTLCGTMAQDNTSWKYRDAFRALDGQSVELETSHIFNDQWNGASLRLHDFYSVSISDVRHRISGYWLEITPEMRDIRANTCACGYCGKQVQKAEAKPFCDKCIDSEYLKAEELHLLRMRPVCETGNRAKLTQAESDYLLPIYRNAQIHGSTERGKARLANLRATLTANRDKAIHRANVEHDGQMWLCDHGITESAIYYSHTGRFGFGWSRPVGKEVINELRAALAGFPFDYDIKEA